MGIVHFDVHDILRNETGNFPERSKRTAAGVAELGMGTAGIV